MNGWLKAAPTLVRLSRCYSGRFRTSILLHRRDFAAQSPGTHLSDILSNSARPRDANEPPFIRRGVAVTNLPPGTTAQQLLDLVRTGAIEYVELSKDGTRADLSFIHGYSAARFASAPPTLLGIKLRCTWLPYRPLHPVVAAAFERDRARRTLLLCKKHEREGTWAARRLQRYLKGALERVTVHEVRDSKLKEVYREVAEARFCDIASAIRAHARLRADPFMMSVHIAYGADPCEFPSPSPFSDSDHFEALTSEPCHLPLTYFPATTSASSSSGTQADADMDAIYRPFTTVTLSNLPARTTVRDLCKRVFGGPVWAVEVDDERCIADVTFFHPEHARDFYAGATTRGFTLRGRKVRVQPRAGEAPVFSTSASADAEDVDANKGAPANVDGDEDASRHAAAENANVKKDASGQGDKSVGAATVERADGATDTDAPSSADPNAFVTAEHADAASANGRAQLPQIHVQPQPPQDHEPAQLSSRAHPEEEPHPPSALDHEQYTRVLRLRAHDPALAQRLTRLRAQVAQDFGAYGVLEGVQVWPSSSRAPLRPRALHVAFARALDARRARAHIALARPEYAARFRIEFGRDVCERGVPGRDEGEGEVWEDREGDGRREGRRGGRVGRGAVGGRGAEGKVGNENENGAEEKQGSEGAGAWEEEREGEAVVEAAKGRDWDWESREVWEQAAQRSAGHSETSGEWWRMRPYETARDSEIRATYAFLEGGEISEPSDEWDREKATRVFQEEWEGTGRPGLGPGRASEVERGWGEDMLYTPGRARDVASGAPRELGKAERAFLASLTQRNKRRRRRQRHRLRKAAENAGP